MSYTIRCAPEAPGLRTSGLTATADNLDGALAAAWQLNRHTERAVEILDDDPDPEDGPGPQLVATLSVEWHGQ